MWRGFDEDELKKAYPHTTTPAEWIPKLVKRFKLNDRREQEQIKYAWEHTMDPEIVAHAHPENIVRGVLYVQVENSAWHAEIVRFHRHDILRRLQACLGTDTIKKIAFKTF